jgi:hypothetical protein
MKFPAAHGTIPETRTLLLMLVLAPNAAPRGTWPEATMTTRSAAARTIRLFGAILYILLPVLALYSSMSLDRSVIRIE